MVNSVTPSEFHERPALGDWRALLNGIEAGFVTGSFRRSASFVRDVIDAAEASDRHADVDLRLPDRVHVALATHGPNGLAEADIELASAISALAAEAGIVSEPRSPLRVEVAIDAVDIDAIRPFWKAVLGYVDEPAPTEGGQVTALVDPLRIGPPFWFQQMDALRPQRNHIHIDVIVAHDVADERVAAVIAAGGRLLTDEYARSFWVLADAEGNEACVCTWQDRD